jgi:hypothetical protein
MNKVNSKQSLMWYAPHHFVFLPLMAILTGVGAYKSFNDEEHRLAWGLFGTLAFCILYLAVMMRQHYALGNQDRIIRMEMRLRYFELTGNSFSFIEHQLTFSQIAALRFADDDQLINLTNRAIKENLSAGEIKNAVKHWVKDDMRL